MELVESIAVIGGFLLEIVKFILEEVRRYKKK